MFEHETKLMSDEKLKKFLAWFDQEIGTDYEVNQLDENSSYVLCLDLSPSELNRVIDYENGKGRLC